MTDLFKEKAPEWDVNEMVKALSAGIGAAIQANVTLNSSMHVMDFGAGTGLITAQVADKVNKVSAIDVSEAMLAQLAAKPELQGKVETLCQNIIEQPLGTEFDLIVSAMAMHHVENTDMMVQRFAEHLKSGAKVALADLDKEDGTFHPADVEGVYHSGFERNEFKSLLEKHGFAEINFVTAHTVNKEGKEFPIFLATATRT